MEIIGYFFFTLISKYIDQKFFELSETVNENLARGILPAIIVFVTIHFMFSGMRIAMGDSTTNMRELLFRTLKITAMVSIISTSMFYSTTLQNTILGIRTDITNAFHTGAGANIYEQIDKSLDKMAMGIAVVDGITTGSDVGLSESKGRALTLSLVGQASPPMIGGLLLLINEIGLRIAIMLAPLFLTAFMFKRTEDMFYTWLRFMVGSMFSLGVFSMAVGIMSDLTVKFGTAIVLMKAALYTAGANTGLDTNLPQLNESVMQAGFGVVMSVMLMVVPFIVNKFFGSDMGGHIYNAFSYAGGASPQSDAGRYSQATGGPSASGLSVASQRAAEGGADVGGGGGRVGAQRDSINQSNRTFVGSPSVGAKAAGQTLVNKPSTTGYRGLAVTKNSSATRK
jgi:type IV secretion system protein VirB6